MKKIVLTSLLMLSILTSAAFAEGLKVGIGYGAGSSIAFEASTIKVPLDFDFGLRIEPELGISEKLITLAVGGYYGIMKVEGINVYAGGRLGLTKGDYVGDPTGTSLQAVVGTEYFLVDKKLSLALQVGLEVASGDLNGSAYNNNGYGTTGSITVRYFLF